MQENTFEPRRVYIAGILSTLLIIFFSYMLIDDSLKPPTLLEMRTVEVVESGIVTQTLQVEGGITAVVVHAVTDDGRGMDPVAYSSVPLKAGDEVRLYIKSLPKAHVPTQIVLAEKTERK